MYGIAAKTAAWIETHVKPTTNGWYPRRSTSTGEHYTLRPGGKNDPLFEKSADGLYVIQLMTALTKRGLADYTKVIEEKVTVGHCGHVRFTFCISETACTDERFYNLGLSDI